MENTITAIPVVSKEVNYFRSSTIKVIPEPERAEIEQLASIEIKEPMFKVVEGDRNYIYSFSKIFDGIDKEILKLNQHRSTSISISLSAFIFSVVCLFVFDTNSIFRVFIGIFAIVFCLMSLWDFFTTKHKAMIKNLEVKKSYVLNESQVYLKNLEQEVKKPVVVV